ncbi:MAG: DUF4190 domain-containing protein [Bacteroidales bacterium]|jgi:hypothetical protein|nr:DUF4190 domain-containing protein [Bacteroidales bacterium]
MEEQLNVETQQPLQPQPPQPPQPPVPIPLPNATASLVLGILSIVSFCCYGIIGLILGTIGLVLGYKAVELYNSSPGVYSKVAYQNAHAGKVCSIIGLSLSVIYVVFLLTVFSEIFNIIREFSSLYHN